MFSKKSLQNFFSGEKGLQKFFSGVLHLRKTKKGLRKFSVRFLAFSNDISTVQNIVLSLSQGQGNFRGLEASRPRTSRCVLEDSTFDSNPISYLARFFWKKISATHTPDYATLLFKYWYCCLTDYITLSIPNFVLYVFLDILAFSMFLITIMFSPSWSNSI